MCLRGWPSWIEGFSCISGFRWSGLLLFWMAPEEWFPYVFLSVWGTLSQYTWLPTPCRAEWQCPPKGWRHTVEGATTSLQRQVLLLLGSWGQDCQLCPATGLMQRRTLSECVEVPVASASRQVEGLQYSLLVWWDPWGRMGGAPGQRICRSFRSLGQRGFQQRPFSGMTPYFPRPPEFPL